MKVARMSCDVKYGHVRQVHAMYCNACHALSSHAMPRQVGRGGAGWGRARQAKAVTNVAPCKAGKPNSKQLRSGKAAEHVFDIHSHMNVYIFVYIYT